MRKNIILLLSLAVLFFISCQEEFQNVEEEITIEEIVEEINYKDLQKQFLQHSFLSTINPNIIGSTNEEESSNLNASSNSGMLVNEIYEEINDWVKPSPTLGQIISEIGFPAWEHTFVKNQLEGIEGVVLLPFTRSNGNRITAILYCFKISDKWNFKLSYSSINPLATETGKQLHLNVEEFANQLLFGNESLISDLNYTIPENGLKTIELDCIEEWECIVPPIAFTGGLPCNWEYQGEICLDGGGGGGNGGVLTSSGSSGSHYGEDDAYDNTQDDGGTTGTGTIFDGDEEGDIIKDFVYSLPYLNLQERKWLLQNPEMISFYKELDDYYIDETGEDLSEGVIKGLIFIMDAEMSGAGIENLTDSELEALITSQLDEELEDAVLVDGVSLFTIYLILEARRLRDENPDWPWWKVGWKAYSNVWNDGVHTILDIAGLIPGFGEYADLTNGTIYLIQGDGINAAISGAGAIPIVGWTSTGTRLASRVVTTSSGSKSTLRWLVDGLGNIVWGRSGYARKQLRTIIKPLAQHEAHHIIPWGLKDQPLVQQAARSGNNSFHINQAGNGIGLPKTTSNNPNNLPIHNGSHPDYTDQIEARMELIYNSNMTPAQANAALNNMINSIRNSLNNPINAGISINSVNIIW